MFSYVAACFACCLSVLTFSTNKVIARLNSIKTSTSDFQTEKFNLILMLAVFDFSFLMRIVFCVFYFPRAVSDPNNYDYLALIKMDLVLINPSQYRRWGSSQSRNHYPATTLKL